MRRRIHGKSAFGLTRMMVGRGHRGGVTSVSGGRRAGVHPRQGRASSVMLPVAQPRSTGNFGTPTPVAGVIVVAATMMTNERKIWEAALLLVRRHGSSAAEVAHREVQRQRSDGDALTCVVWCWIARSTAELLRPFPDKGERVH